MTAVLQKTASSTGESAQVEGALDAKRVSRQLEALYPSSGKHSTRGCHILDAKYEPGCRCTVLYEFEGHYVLGVIPWGPPEDRITDGERSIEDLGMRVYEFPNDPSILDSRPCSRPG